MVYSPLEQFEPVSFFGVLLGNINLSITSITFMFFFIMAILPFLMNGSLFYFNVKNIFNVKVNDGSPLLLTSGSHQNFSTSAISPTSSDKNVNTLNLLYSNFTVYRNVFDHKCSNLSLDNFKNKYICFFYMAFFKVLSLKNSAILSSFVFFKIDNLLKSFSKTLLSGTVSGKSNTLFKFLESFKNDLFLKRLFMPTGISFIFEFIFKFILDQVKSGIVGSTKKAVQFFPIIFTLFSFILLSNLLGLIPYSSTVTAYIIITLTLSIMVNVGVTIYGFQNHGLHFFSLFLPPGVPLFLWPILIPIEIISYFIKVVSLSVRLFANMMAGHTLLAVLAGFGWTMATSSALLFVVHPLPVLVVFVLVGLELAVACIQAFVFALLTSIYISDSINLH